MLCGKRCAGLCRDAGCKEAPGGNENAYSLCLRCRTPLCNGNDGAARRKLSCWKRSVTSEVEGSALDRPRAVSRCTHRAEMPERTSGNDAPGSRITTAPWWQADWYWGNV